MHGRKDKQITDGWKDGCRNGGKSRKVGSVKRRRKRTIGKTEGGRNGRIGGWETGSMYDGQTIGMGGRKDGSVKRTDKAKISAGRERGLEGRRWTDGWKWW